MAKLEWDALGEHFYETGVSKGVLFTDPDTSTGEYQNAYVWNGLTGVTESPDGAEANDFWADNIKYASLRSAETFGGTIEAYTYPNKFAECDGTALIYHGVKVGQQTRKSFAFCYRTEIGNDSSNDAGYQIHIIYNATASPTEKSYETINDSPDAITFSWEFDTVPVNVGTIATTDYKPTSLITIDSRYVTKALMTTLENKLYGTDSESPKLPSPSEVIRMFSSNPDPSTTTPGT